ncbi:AfsR/SARP family transcriptional regulator [Actinomadura oligospora]|uniref:AfsR/SARP family transcriptional regulator n=1 Tax=Actinomadura oligospora TaxID=111804 RepID=UPI0004B641DD|nr:AfsR/SARP family transcriptional regulator [Actinomadura oligospora]
MEFSVLGPVEARDGGVPLAIGGALRRALLAALLLEPGRVVSDDSLVQVLWAVPPETARAQIRQHVSGLRRVLGAGTIVRRGSGYMVDAEPCSVDLAVFVRSTELARTASGAGRTADAAALLRDALALWHGEPLGGAAHDFVRRAAPALEERRLAAVEDCFDAELAEGRHTELVGEILAEVERHPLRERMRGQLMIALYRCGRQSEALEVFREGGRLLREEVGLDPGPRLRALERAVHAEDPVLDPPVRAAGPQGAAEQALRLPADLADFTGREVEIARLFKVLAEGAQGDRPTVCAISGAPGTGKSALAVRLAHMLGAAFPGGCVHVDLRDHGGDPARALARLLRLLGVADVADAMEERVDQYLDLLSRRRILVVLDNAEREAAVRPLLPQAPGCAALVTARGPLPGLSGLPGLHRTALRPFPAATAHEMLARIAGRARAQAEPEAVAEIAELCGFLPLALRIAGTRLAMRPHAQVGRFAARLHSAARRLDELRAADLDLRRVLATATLALAAPARRAFAVLGPRSVRFCATEAAVALGVSLENAEDVIDELAGAGLIEFAGHDVGGHDTYRFPELLRLHALEYASEYASERVPGHVPEGALEYVSEGVGEQASGRVPGQALKYVSECASGHASECAPGLADVDAGEQAHQPG